MAKILNISGAEIKDRGIQKLAEYVEANLPDEFTLVIGCKPSIYDVDAVLIGRGNIYAIECKDWKGNIKGGTYGWWQKDRQVIENPLQQARTNAVALGRWMRKNIKAANKSIWVKSLLVFTHEDSQLNLTFDKKSNTSVSIVNLGGLKKWIEKQKILSDPKFISMINDWFNNIKGDAISESRYYINADLQNKISFELKAIYATFSILSIIAIFLYGLEAIFYIAIIIIFFFLFIRPSIKRLQKKTDSYRSLEQSHVSNDAYESDISRDPAYTNVTVNIWHREQER